MSWLFTAAAAASAVLTPVDSWATTLDRQSRAEKAEAQSSRDATRAEIMNISTAESSATAESSGTSTQSATGGETTGDAGSNSDHGSSSENGSTGNRGQNSGDGQ